MFYGFSWGISPYRREDMEQPIQGVMSFQLNSSIRYWIGMYRIYLEVLMKLDFASPDSAAFTIRYADDVAFSDVTSRGFLSKLVKLFYIPIRPPKDFSPSWRW